MFLVANKKFVLRSVTATRRKNIFCPGVSGVLGDKENWLENIRWSRKTASQKFSPGLGYMIFGLAFSGPIKYPIFFLPAAHPDDKLNLLSPSSHPNKLSSRQKISKKFFFVSRQIFGLQTNFLIPLLDTLEVRSAKYGCKLSGSAT